MDEDNADVEGITREDVVDALADSENTEGLSLLTLYYEQSNGDSSTMEKQVKNAKQAGQLLFDAKRYEDVVAWLDQIATEISDTKGPDSEDYMAFAEDEDLETLRMKATDKMFGDEEEDDFEVEDE